jgi:hypothetical protein
LDRYKEFNPSLPGKNTLLMKGMTQPEDEQKINTAPCFGGREMFKNGRTGFPVPILIKPGNRIGESTVSRQDVPNQCLKVKIHGTGI